MIYHPAYNLVKLTSKIFFPITVHGYEHVPRRGAFIIASNHRSYIDPLILGLSSRRRLSYVAKAEIFKNKMFAWVLHEVGAFPIQRHAADLKALKEALRRLKGGSPLVVFPEGTRLSESKKVNPGVGFLAAKSGVPILPAFIHGSEGVLPPGAKFLRRHPVTVRFGNPVTIPAGKPYSAAAEDIIARIRELA